MASTAVPFDPNYRVVMAAKVQGTTADVAPILVDAITGRVLVDANVTITGGATEAKQDTIIGHLDGVEGSLANIDTDTTTIIGHLDGVETLLGTIDTSLNDIETQLEEEWLIHRSLDLDESEEEIKGTAGKVGGWYFFNAAITIRYIKFYNATAANVTVGTTTPIMTIPIPAQSSGGIAANVLSNKGIGFSTAISIAATTGVADTDTGAPGVNEVIVNVFYK